MLNWIIWNRTDHFFKLDLTLKTYKGWYAIKPTNRPTLAWSPLGIERDWSDWLKADPSQIDLFEDYLN